VSGNGSQGGTETSFFQVLSHPLSVFVFWDIRRRISLKFKRNISLPFSGSEVEQHEAIFA
jgi:hypothetical protein